MHALTILDRLVQISSMPSIHHQAVCEMPAVAPILSTKQFLLIPFWFYYRVHLLSSIGKMFDFVIQKINVEELLWEHLMVTVTMEWNLNLVYIVVVGLVIALISVLEMGSLFIEDAVCMLLLFFMERKTYRVLLVWVWNTIRSRTIINLIWGVTRVKGMHIFHTGSVASVACGVPFLLYDFRCSGTLRQ
ncbi:hypothetical protein IMY05_003G0157000 [Salix suchowensis]|nr:hypothetical protein IMY05_003G0157000 [Salix suchowensis]